MKLIYGLAYLLLGCLFSLSADKLETQIGQLFVGTFYGDQVTEESQALIKETQIGNWIFFSKCSTLTQPTQVSSLLKQLSDNVRQVTSLEPLFLIDQEGGRVSHLTGEFTLFPTPADWKDSDQAYAIGLKMGKEMRAVGFHVNLAPVVDIAALGTLERFRQRMFGEDPERVVLMARAFIQGLHHSHVLAVLKHFPGHGAASVDSHLGLPVIKSTMAELEQREFKPFRALLKEADGIMVGHLLIPAGDPNKPTSLSSFWQTELLRQTWGYQGVILTDSLTMHGVLEGELQTFEQVAEAISKAAQQAFLAGSDLILIGPLDQFPFEHSSELNQQLLKYVVSQFRQAVHEGKIPKSRLEESVNRIMKLKHR